MINKLDQKGVSFIELVIVVSIVLILTVISIPSFNRLSSNQRLNSAAATLLGDIRSARELAIKEGWQYGILFDSTTQYRIIKATQPTFAQSAGSFTAVASRVFTSRMMGFRGITMAVPVKMPVFHRSGSVSSWNSSTNSYTSAAPDIVTLTNSYSKSRRVSVGIMGYSQIQCVGTC